MTEFVIDDKCLMCGAVFRIISDKQRVKTTCDHCGARFMTVKGKEVRP
jgi:DNA-directed RNA polymerase subunit RPC12/RpoP